jgi:hypothetical protein
VLDEWKTQLKGVVPKKRISKGATNQVVQIDDTHDVAGEAMDDKKAPMGIRRRALQIAGKCLGCGWGRDPSLDQPGRRCLEKGMKQIVKTMGAPPCYGPS